MHRRFAELQEIKQDIPVTVEADSSFFYHVLYALLADLQESGYLQIMQYRKAVEILKKQHKEGSD